MAKRHIERTVMVCDICGRQDSYLRECICCGREFCMMCDAIIPGCVTPPRACRQCGKDEQVIAICDAAANEMLPIIRARNGQLKRLKISRLSIVEEATDATDAE